MCDATKPLAPVKKTLSGDPFIVSVPVLCYCSSARQPLPKQLVFWNGTGWGKMKIYVHDVDGRPYDKKSDLGIETNLSASESRRLQQRDRAAHTILRACAQIHNQSIEASTAFG